MSPDPIILARDIGRDSIKFIGEIIFEELEKAYISTLLTPIPKYPDLRLYQHLFIHGPMGTYKDLICKKFIENCIPDEYKVKELTDCTVQTFGGSVTSTGKLYKPLFLGYKMCLITEFTAFMKSEKELRGQMATLNKILEGNTIGRDLIKLGELQQSERDSYSHESVDGLKIVGDSLVYKPSTQFIFCSHILDESTIKLLTTNAFFDRCKFIQYDVSDEDAETLWGNNPLIEFNLSKLGELKEVNKGLFQELPKMVTTLPEGYEATIKQVFKDVKHEAEKMQTPIVDIYGARQATNLIREMVIRHMVGNPLDKMKLDTFRNAGGKDISCAEDYTPRRKVGVLVRELNELFASGPKTFGEIQSAVSIKNTRTIYNALNGHFQKKKYGTWGVKE
ncbi:MAG: hypothetical protein NTV61_04580 [Candidatus Bathyarchaeota archaeon]|nr:hypothetical protein [Candidatus Bathyarchaeota archaeon]